MYARIAWLTKHLALLVGIGLLTPKGMALSGEGFAKAELVLEASAGSRSDQIGVLWAEEGGRLWPVDFAVDKVGNIWIMDYVNRRLKKFSSTGEFLLDFSGRPELEITVTCRYVEVTPNGDVVIGPIDREGHSFLALVDGKGQLKKILSIPGPPVDELDFGIDGSGRIVFDAQHAERPATVVIDQEGHVEVYEGGPTITGANISPYTAYVVHTGASSPGMLRVADHIRPGAVTRSVQLEGNPPNSVRILWYRADRSGNLVTLIYSPTQGKRRMVLYSRNGRLLQVVPNCPRLSHERSHIHFTLDSEGNLYEMELIPVDVSGLPSGVQVEDESQIVLRVWKWERKQ